MDRENFKKWVCTALEMEEKGMSLYQKVADECTTKVGQEVFSMLRDDEVKHIEKIKDIERALDQEAGLEQACTLQESDRDPGKIFRELAGKVEAEKPCASTVKALSAGIDFELALVRFYEDALEKASEDLERQFLKRMVNEEKAHFILLSDMQDYYQDPEGWYMQQERAGLDGA